MQNNFEIQALKKYITDNDITKVRKIVLSFHPADLAEEVENWEYTDVVKLIRILKNEYSSDLFQNLSQEKQEEVLNSLEDKDVLKIFDELEADEAVDVLEDLPYEFQQSLLSKLSKESKEDIYKILKYSENDAGYYMSLNFISINENMKISEARKSIRKQLSDGNEMNDLIFVTSKDNLLRGQISLENLTLAKDDDKIIDYIEKAQYVDSKSTIRKVKDISIKYDVTSIPVVSVSKKILGVIMSNTIIEIFNEISETLNPIEKKEHDKKHGNKIVKPYSKQTIFELFQSRIMWILMLLFIGLITQIIITGFQMIWSNQTDFWQSGTMGATVIITLAFSTALSVASSINDSAGNTGSQTSTSIIESIAMKEITDKDLGKIVWKETKVGLLMGAAVAFGSIFRTYLVWAMFGFLGGNTGMEAAYMFLIASVAAISFFFCVVFGNFLGAIIPMLGLKYKWDSAIFTGPLSTTVIDIFVFIFYLGLTTAIFVPLANSGIFDYQIEPETFIITSIMINTL